MNSKKLHTTSLENLYGPISCDIIRQDNEIRIVHLRDKKNVSRTVGVVRFYNTDHKTIKTVHKTILSGELLGKTLKQSRIHYNKETIGAVTVRLPDWIIDNFPTKEEHSVAVISFINIDTSFNGPLLYTRIIEVLPPDLSTGYENDIIQKQDIDNDILPLFELADLTIENIIV
ncbi:hypothetical protein [uncultured Eudoraea sp.]|uniref:hypothetical protein n=1 Tax=uncultured Eudoraea sp. TaxID=1035614 RepID=UPI002602623E|nr:hypothetical protein [uncultured Eudoraea sp.]